ncbi:hypothetical protein HRbin25_00854 [bacterium HR25]|nr:hypothetical protein HRbin25_00854 [bacterium HR25]
MAALTAADLFQALQAALSVLEAQEEALNAINVFPVPDGDTGTNMLLTLRSTLTEAERQVPQRENASVAQLLEALGRGALMGARGNSGVILSQIVRGLARGVGPARELDARALVQGLEEATRLAYQVITQPREGTILTVVREAAEAARAALERGETDVVAVLGEAARAARESVERTPQLLPVLAEAGVVDAGGQGLWLVLEAMRRHLTGEPLETLAPPGRASLQREWVTTTQELHQTGQSRYGYCTEFLVEGQGLDSTAIRARMEELGDSVLVVGDERLLRVHLHTDDPGAAISHGTRVGELLEVKVDNIQRQADRFLDQHEAAAEVEAPVVAVAQGRGLAAVLRSMGALVVPGGPTMNPSAGDLLDAIQRCPGDEVIVLPNDKNIVAAAHQAAELTGKRVAVVPTRSVPQGIAALLAYSPERSLEENVRLMEEAAAAVRTIEVTRAVRDTRAGGLTVREGDAIAIVDGELKVAAAGPEEALQKAVEGLGVQEGLLTVYYGAEATAERAEALAESLRRRFPQLEVEVVAGGQPHYPYIASLE